MAFPTIRAVASGQITSDLYEVTITLPTGHAQGDLLIIGWSHDGNAAMTAPAGWSLLVDGNQQTSNRFRIWTKVRGSSESNPTITWSSNPERGTWFSFAITTGTWSGLPEVSIASGSSTTPATTTLTPSWGARDTLWFGVYAWDYNWTSTTVPSLYTQRTYVNGTATTSAGHKTFSRTINTTSQSAGSITISGTDTWYAVMIAVRDYVVAPEGFAVKVGGVYKNVSQQFVQVSSAWKPVVDQWVKVGGVWKKTPYFNPNVSEWVDVYYGSQNATVNYYSPTASCQTAATVKTWFDTNYPVTNYTYGYKIRVVAYTYNFEWCSEYIFQAL